jgi:3-oxoacyl-[acyl-carrier protein] reductase
MNQIDLQDRTAIVTGAAQGIGRAIAERLVASGAAVWLWDHDSALLEATVRALGDGARGVAVDVTDPDGIADAARHVADTAGGIDILVANAGISGANATVEDYPVDEWRRVIDINLNGVFHCCRAVVPYMRAAGYGRIVTIASIAGKEGNPNASAYSASKAGVIALTKSLGKELAGLDIAVNAVTPAAARTAIFDQMTEEHIDYMLQKIPRGRFVKVDEIAGLVAWLASEENAFSTGAVFDISGGRATY